MSDVILYAALKENARLQRAYTDAVGTNLQASYFTQPQPPGYPYVAGSGPYNPLCPPMVCGWKQHLSPNIRTGTSGLKVCETVPSFRCGATCSWTVPAGVTRAQFQLWGPGSGTSANCCCGGSPFGPSGAYAMVQLDVVAGNVYTICAGCAFCCCASQTTPGLCGGPSFVTGPGLCICADSGISCLCFWNQDLGSGSCACAIPDPNAIGGSFCSAHGCSGYNFCYDTFEDATLVCHAFSRASWRVNCAGTGRNLLCWGVNGLWPHMKVGGIGQCLNGDTCSVSTPVVGYESCVCTETWSSGVTCNGFCRSATQGFLQIPGAGGYANRVFAGCNACAGDHGRMGMVCISWGGI